MWYIPICPEPIFPERTAESPMYPLVTIPEVNVNAPEEEPPPENSTKSLSVVPFLYQYLYECQGRKIPAENSMPENSLNRQM